MLNSGDVSLSLKLKPLRFELLQYDFFQTLEGSGCALLIFAFPATKILPNAQGALI